MSPIISFLTGPCAAGKTTVGKLLAQNNRFERAVFLESDAIRRMVWQGYVPPFPESAASRKQLLLSATSTARVAKTYYDAGFHVIIEDILEPSITSVYRDELQNRQTETFCLLPSKDELLRRDLTRSRSEQMGDRCLELWQAFRQWAEAEGWNTMDPTGQTPEQTVDKLSTLLCTPSEPRANGPAG